MFVPRADAPRRAGRSDRYGGTLGPTDVHGTLG